MPLSTSVQVTAGVVHGRVFEQPKFGDIVGSMGATVIHYAHQSDAGKGFYAHGIALCHYVHNIGEFVVWQLVYDPYAYHLIKEPLRFCGRGGWLCQSGSYPATFDEAVQLYQERKGG